MNGPLIMGIQAWDSHNATKFGSVFTNREYPTSKVTQSGETLLLFICFSVETTLVASVASCPSTPEDNPFLRIDLTTCGSYSG